jgi:hypothetical protein
MWKTSAAVLHDNSVEAANETSPANVRSLQKAAGYSFVFYFYPIMVLDSAQTISQGTKVAEADAIILALFSIVQSVKLVSPLMLVAFLSRIHFYKPKMLVILHMVENK